QPVALTVTCLQYRQNVAPLPIWYRLCRANLSLYRLYRANLSMLSYPVVRAARAGRRGVMRSHPQTCLRTEKAMSSSRGERIATSFTAVDGDGTTKKTVSL